MRKTKIIATIGPASQDETILTNMCLAGMNVARINFSHGDYEQHKKTMDLVKSVREKLNLPIAIMLDTKGPEYRIGKFINDKVEIPTGSEFSFVTDEIMGDETKVSVTYKSLAEDLNPGDMILVNNGLVEFRVKELKEGQVVCETVTGGVLSNNKSMNFPNKLLSGDYLSEKDKADLLFGIENGVDFVAASFVSEKKNVQDMRHFLDKNGGKSIEIIAKIENQAGVDNVDEICQIADGIMVARGDLGVEVPYVNIPSIQKMLIGKCRFLGKRVITATEMLESMITNIRPTRAEISDVANAVYEGTSAVMLSGETAAGKYPVEAVKTMADIAEITEKNTDYTKIFRTTEFQINNKLDAISHGTCAMATVVNAKCIVVNSVSGKTAAMISRFRCPVDIIGMTTSVEASRKLNLNWGVHPVICESFESVDVMFYQNVRKVTELLGLQSGDNVVLTCGKINGESGNTDQIKIETIK